MLFTDMGKKSRIVFIVASVFFVLVTSTVFAFTLKKAVPRPLDTKQMQMEQTKIKKEEKAREEEKTEQETGQMPSAKLKSLKVSDSYREGDLNENQDIVEDMDFYEVGKDIDPGLYRLVSTVKDSSYYRISKAKDDKNINTVSESVFLNFTYVDLKQGQFLYLVDAKAEKKESCIAYKAKDGIYENGQYLVGFDIKQGMYKVIPKGEAGYVSISSSSFDTDPVLNKYFDEPIVIKIKNGQFLTLSMSKLKLEK